MLRKFMVDTPGIEAGVQNTLDTESYYRLILDFVIPQTELVNFILIPIN